MCILRYKNSEYFYSPFVDPEREGVVELAHTLVELIGGKGGRRRRLSSVGYGLCCCRRRRRGALVGVVLAAHLELLFHLLEHRVELVAARHQLERGRQVSVVVRRRRRRRHRATIVATAPQFHVKGAIIRIMMTMLLMMMMMSVRMSGEGGVDGGGRRLLEILVEEALPEEHEQRMVERQVERSLAPLEHGEHAVRRQMGVEGERVALVDGGERLAPARLNTRRRRRAPGDCSAAGR